jgi:hypothetical protein
LAHQQCLNTFASVATIAPPQIHFTNARGANTRKNNSLIFGRNTSKTIITVSFVYEDKRQKFGENLRSFEVTTEMFIDHKNIGDIIIC